MRKMGIWREYLIEKLADRERAINYLQAILEDYQIFEDSTQAAINQPPKTTNLPPNLLDIYWKSQ